MQEPHRDKSAHSGLAENNVRQAMHACPNWGLVVFSRTTTYTQRSARMLPQAPLVAPKESIDHDQPRNTYIGSLRCAGSSEGRSETLRVEETHAS